MKEFIILFVLFFIIIYLFYYFLYRRKKLVYDKKTLSADIKILEGYYKVNTEKIGYQKVLRIMNLVNSLMLTIMIMIVYKLNNYIYKFLILVHIFLLIQKVGHMYLYLLGNIQYILLLAIFYVTFL